MKIQKEREDLKDLTLDELKAKIEDFRKELFSLHLNASTTHIKDYSQFNKLQKSVARALTYLHQRQSEQQDSKR